MNTKPCTRCLLKEAGNADLSAQIKEQIKRFPEKEKVSSTEYDNRLKLCLICDNLYQGTCLKCGCYVELRALANSSHCPAVPKHW